MVGCLAQIHLCRLSYLKAGLEIACYYILYGTLSANIVSWRIPWQRLYSLSKIQVQTSFSDVYSHDLSCSMLARSDTNGHPFPLHCTRQLRVRMMRSVLLNGRAVQLVTKRCRKQSGRTKGQDRHILIASWSQLAYSPLMIQVGPWK